MVPIGTKNSRAHSLTGDTQTSGGTMRSLFKKVGISGVVFYDMGNAYNLEDRYCSGLQRKKSSVSIKFDPCFNAVDSLTSGLRKSVGFGFRWFSPIGPLRFEWGIPLDPQVGEDPLVFEFTIGNFF